MQLHLGLLEIAETAEQVARLRIDAMTSLPRRLRAHSEQFACFHSPVRTGATDRTNPPIV